MSGLFSLPQLGAAPSAPFPPLSKALEIPNGLLAWGGDLHPERLLKAYRQGIFPWYSEGQPILWWSPAPRCVLVPEKVHLSRRTRRRFNGGDYRLSINRAFETVISACANIRSDGQGTWITTEMRAAYIRLHRMGHAQSLEVWNGNDLAGGIYGLALGQVFFGESMFSGQVDGSKIALVALCRLLADAGYVLLDCQVGNPHLYTMGAEDMGRARFQAALQTAIEQAKTHGDWRVRDLAIGRW